MGWRDYTQLFNERVRGELGRINDVVINTAISGNTTDNLLAGFDERAAIEFGDIARNAAHFMVEARALSLDEE